MGFVKKIFQSFLEKSTLLLIKGVMLKTDSKKTAM